MGYDKLASEYSIPLYPLPTSMRPSGRLAAPIQCVLFDIYGTLFISGSGDIGLPEKTTAEAEKIEGLLQKFNIRKTPRALMNELFEAVDSEHRQLRNDGIDYPEIEIDQIWKQILKIDDLEAVRRFAIEYELIVNPVYPMPHLEKTLAVCRKQNLPMGIISNAQFFTPLLFEWFLHARPVDLGFHSELIFLSYRIRHAKPSMVPFRKAARVIRSKGFNPAASLYVGNDMLNDIYPAKQFGFQTALFAGDTRSLRLRGDDPRCVNLSPDLVLTDLKQLIGHITGSKK
ncbi:MAG: HAD family hydrolase [Desulfobacterales bacterium]|jgi:putative hydrolase of the HAD superfamily